MRRRRGTSAPNYFVFALGALRAGLSRLCLLLLGWRRLACLRQAPPRHCPLPSWAGRHQHIMCSYDTSANVTHGPARVMDPNIVKPIATDPPVGDQWRGRIDSNDRESRYIGHKQRLVVEGRRGTDQVFYLRYLFSCVLLFLRNGLGRKSRQRIL